MIGSRAASKKVSLVVYPDREALSTALYDRFGSRGEADFADKLLSALRYEFGGHEVKAAVPKGGAA